MTEGETVGWHHWLNGHEFEETPGGSEGPGSLVCCSPWVHKESWLSDWTTITTTTTTVYSFNKHFLINSVYSWECKSTLEFMLIVFCGICSSCFYLNLFCSPGGSPWKMKNHRDCNWPLFSQLCCDFILSSTHGPHTMSSTIIYRFSWKQFSAFSCLESVFSFGVDMQEYIVWRGKGTVDSKQNSVLLCEHFSMNWSTVSITILSEAIFDPIFCQFCFCQHTETVENRKRIRIKF